MYRRRLLGPNSRWKALDEILRSVTAASPPKSSRKSETFNATAGGWRTRNSSWRHLLSSLCAWKMNENRCGTHMKIVKTTRSAKSAKSSHDLQIPFSGRSFEFLSTFCRNFRQILTNQFVILGDEVLCVIKPSNTLALIDAVDLVDQARGIGSWLALPQYMG